MFGYGEFVMKQKLLQIAKLLLLIDMVALENHLETAQQDFEHVRDVGSVLNPTRYREDVLSGNMENSELQIAIVGHLLEARQLIEKLNPSVKLQLIASNLGDENVWDELIRFNQEDFEYLRDKMHSTD